MTPAAAPLAPSASPEKLRYCADLFGYKRRKTRVVMVGKVGVGGDQPIRVQSMTTADTMKPELVVAESIRMVQAGCEILRVTTPTVQDARNLEKIKAGLLKAGIDVPLVADVHFSPASAMEAADFAEKVRINPGNFVDSKRFAQKEYTDAEYDSELARIEERFTPLVEKLKRLKRALRLGSNHGSLSDRIMNRYGDSPLGMVESALEYLRICRKNDYHDVILSMKASNPKVMIAAYRLLVARMDAEGMDYPLHLGVTEAGMGEDGRIKSAIGIGSLLEDGLGDTIRVSLTEDSEHEMPVAYALARRFYQRPVEFGGDKDLSYCADLYAYERRKTQVVNVGPFALGGEVPPRLVCSLPKIDEGREAGPVILEFFEAQLKSGKGREPEILEWRVGTPKDLETLRAARAFLKKETSRLAILGRFGTAALFLEGLGDVDLAAWDGLAPILAGIEPEDLPGDQSGAEISVVLKSALKAGKALLIEGPRAELVASAVLAAERAGLKVIAALRGEDAGALLKEYRLLAARLNEEGSKAPLHLKAPGHPEPLERTLQSSIQLGGLLADGLGDSVEVRLEDPETALALSYDILQGAGARVTKTEFVSCPSCGRTLFDLQTTTERIKSKTGHLKGVKIAIMGCIVNGPGEMADADFGYVGGAPGMINLYVGKECVKKGIPTETADQALIDLIKTHGKWVDPAAC